MQNLADIIYRLTTPQSPNGASSTKARLRMPQALLRCPYTGEPNEVRTNLIQRHRPKPPLCKGRGTTSVVEGLSKAASLHKIYNSLSHLTVPALPRHAYVCHRHYSGALAQGSLSKFVQNLIRCHKPKPPLCKGRWYA